MQPTPTSSLLAAANPRLRAWTFSLHAGLFGALLALGACRDPKVTAYDVPKEAGQDAPAPVADAGMPPPTAPVAPAAAAPDSHGMMTASGPELTWAAPATWQSRPASMMRKATFVLPGENGTTAELAISAFPGDVGGDIANVNRWRGQVGLAPLDDAAANSAITRIEANTLKIGVVDAVDAAAPNATHLLGAMVPYDNATWFFKLVGPDAVVTARKAEFMAFLKTIKPATP